MSKRHNNEFRSEPTGFPVFDTINKIYPSYYKYIVKKFDNSETFNVLLFTVNTGTTNLAPIFLYCDRNNILNTKTLSSRYWSFRNQFGGIDDYLFVPYSSTANRYFRVEVYSKSTLQLLKTISSVGNWYTGYPFCAKINNKHYYQATTNSSRNTPIVICYEDETLNRNENYSYDVFDTIFRYDEDNNVFYIWRYNGNTPKYNPAIYRENTMNGPKYHSGSISNTLQYNSMIGSIPKFDYVQGDQINCYTFYTDNGTKYFTKINISDDYTVVQYDNPILYDNLHSIIDYGAITEDYETFYTLNINTKLIEPVKFW